MRERGRQILAHLGKWLAEAREEELAREYEHIGKTRYEESIPLHESVRALYIIKDKMIDFVKDQGIKRDSMELYAKRRRLAPGRARISVIHSSLTILSVTGISGAFAPSHVEKTSVVL